MLAMKKTACRETTMNDIDLIRQNLKLLIEHHRNNGLEVALRESLMLQERLDEMEIIVEKETEQQIFYTFKLPLIARKNLIIQDSGFMTVYKNSVK
ncbi:hypothetical protein ACIQ2D_01975 [Lysinibacillus sp. NPDC097287]|uniref:hypothetical protein n=1 Tax=Lysinibacillus sp. NPDC097287 TaxID=3364144 RepID=UPI00382925F8